MINGGKGVGVGGGGPWSEAEVLKEAGRGGGV